MNNPPISYACSLGLNCSSAAWIKQEGLKLCSYPFDWVQMENPKDIIHCLKDNFLQFLDIQKLQPRPDKPWKSSHKAYGSIFRHHALVQLKGSAIQVNLKDYAYFVRCVLRLNKLFSKKDKKLFIITFPNQKGALSAESKSLMKELDETLANKTSNYELLVIHHICENRLAKQITKDGAIRYLTITTTLPSNGLMIDDGDALLNWKKLEKGLPYEDNPENQYYNNAISELYSFDIKA
jgi:hypothetical protein